MDLDGDSRPDLLSGSWPGEVYFFRRKADGSFAAAVTLRHADGKAVNVGHASAAFAADWDGDGKPDLIIGTVTGEVVLLRGEGSLTFAKPSPMKAAGKPVTTTSGDAAPVVADWDGDGHPDLLLGADDGSIVWYRNAGKGELQAARPLLAKSKLTEGDRRRHGNECGTRVKLCVYDWDGDGKPDLLVGDSNDSFEGKPDAAATEGDDDRSAKAILPELRREWAAAFALYRKATGKEADELRTKVQRLKDEIARVQDIQDRYRSQYQSHGFVWLLRRQGGGK